MSGEFSVLEKLLTSSAEEWKVPSVPAGRELGNIGPIHRITIPDDWTQAISRYNAIGASAYDEYRPPNETEVRFFFWYRGLPLEDADAKAFAEILERPEHVLHSDEVAKLKELLRFKLDANLFEMKGIQTQNLNGKRVLAIKGLYKEDNKEMLAMLIDGTGTGAVVQEIEFQAPAEKFARYALQAKQAMKSICWK
jgi:hypothetical protein